MAQNKLSALSGVLIALVTAFVVVPSLHLFMPDVPTPLGTVGAPSAVLFTAVYLLLAALGQISASPLGTPKAAPSSDVTGNRLIGALHDVDSVVFLASLTGFLWVTELGAQPHLAQAFFSSTVAFSLAILIYFFNNDAVLGEVGKPERVKHLASTVRTIANNLNSASLIFAFGFFYLGIVFSIVTDLRAPILLITAFIMVPVILEGTYVAKEILQFAFQSSNHHN